MIVSGIDIPDRDLSAALATFDVNEFALRDLQAELESRGVPNEASYEAAKRLLQRERKAGNYLHDATTGAWKATAAATVRMAAPPPPISEATRPEPTQTLPLRQIDEPISIPVTPDEAVSSSFEKVWMAVALMACLAAVLALALINASFAWQVAETESFRVAFVLGLAASDLMRPLLVARGLWEIEQRRILRGFVAIAVAVLLAPVSLISSTAVVSATLHLGMEETADRNEQDKARWDIQTEYDRLTRLSAKTWKAWEDECARGGCGEVDQGLEATAKGFEEDASRRFDELVAFSKGDSERSSFLSRTVAAFQNLGVFGIGGMLGIPLLIALSLEIAALFGPGLLLTRRDHRAG